MGQPREEEQQGRGSSPSVTDRLGTDDWVRGMRLLNGTAAEWFASERAESPTIPAAFPQPATHQGPSKAA